MSKRFESNEAGQIQIHITKGFEKAAHTAIHAAALHIVQDIQVRLIPAQKPPPVDRGIYRAAWRVRSTKRGADIINASVQAPLIEGGVRAANVKPGRVMIDALAKWAKRKGLVGGKGKRATDAARGVAFAIAHSMRKKGIFNRGSAGGKGGLRILEQGLQGLEGYLKKELQRALGKSFK